MVGVATGVYLFDGRRPGSEKEGFSDRAKTMGVVLALAAACLTVLWLPFLRLLATGFLYKKHARVIGEYTWKSLITLPSDMFVAPAIVVVLACVLLTWNRLPKIWVFLLGTVLVFLFPLPWVGTQLSELLGSLGLQTLYLKGVFWASLSFLVPYGLDAYRASRKGAIIVPFAIGVAMLGLAGWQFVALPIAGDDISAFPATAFLLLTSGLSALIVLRTAQGMLSPLLVSAIVLVPLVFPLSMNKLLWNTIDFKTNSVVEFLKANRPHARSVSVDPTLSFAIPPNLGQAYGVRCAEINAVIFLNNYWSMFHHPRALPTMVFFDFLSLDAFAHMGASVVLLPNDAPSSGLVSLIKGVRFSAYSIPGVHGRLYFAERACQYKPSTTIPNQILSLSQDTDAVAVVEGMGHPVPAVIPEIPFAKGKAVFERDDIEDILVHLECPSEGLLVLRDSWYPGWMASIDGKKAPILRINGCFRGVIVPGGAHTLRFVYRPILVYAAGAVSLLSLLFVILVSVGKKRG
jgi:hypothetical protein